MNRRFAVLTFALVAAALLSVAGVCFSEDAVPQRFVGDPVLNNISGASPPPLVSQSVTPAQ